MIQQSRGIHIQREGFASPFLSLLPPPAFFAKPCTADIPFFPSNEGRDRIKIAGAISRAHDTGENAAEALIMADTRRGSRYHVLPLNFQDSHYTNVPPITDPPRRPRPPSLLSPNPALFLNRSQSESCKRGCKNRTCNIVCTWTHARHDRRSEGREGGIVDIPGQKLEKNEVSSSRKGRGGRENDDRSSGRALMSPFYVLI